MELQTKQKMPKRQIKSNGSVGYPEYLYLSAAPSVSWWANWGSVSLRMTPQRWGCQVPCWQSLRRAAGHCAWGAPKQPCRHRQWFPPRKQELRVWSTIRVFHNAGSTVLTHYKLQIIWANSSCWLCINKGHVLHSFSPQCFLMCLRNAPVLQVCMQGSLQPYLYALIAPHFSFQDLTMTYM